ncbi:MAG: helix-turn-helix domain-containing protein [Longibaculum sp.]
MDVCYNRLFKLLIDKGLKKTEFAKQVGIGQNTLAKLSKNEFVSMEVLVKICRGLNCNIEDVVEIIKEDLRDN